MSVSDDVLRIWMAKIKKQLGGYRDHPDFDDLVAEAYLGMWEGLTRASNAIVDLEGYAIQSAWNAVFIYLVSPRNQHRGRNSEGTSLLPSLYLEDVSAGRHPDYAPCRLVSPDFAPHAIERIVTLAELARCPSRLRALLILCCLKQLSREEAGAQLGLSRHQVSRALRGISKDAIPHAGADPCREPRTCTGCGRRCAGENITFDGRCRHCLREKKRRWAGRVASKQR